jgi:hypothetical protein
MIREWISRVAYRPTEGAASELTPSQRDRIRLLADSDRLLAAGRISTAQYDLICDLHQHLAADSTHRAGEWRVARTFDRNNAVIAAVKEALVSQGGIERTSPTPDSVRSPSDATPSRP